jgi:hypothetical protein
MGACCYVFPGPVFKDPDAVGMGWNPGICSFNRQHKVTPMLTDARVLVYNLSFRKASGLDAQSWPWTSLSNFLSLSFSIRKISECTLHGLIVSFKADNAVTVASLGLTLTFVGEGYKQGPLACGPLHFTLLSPQPPPPHFAPAGSCTVQCRHPAPENNPSPWPGVFKLATCLGIWNQGRSLQRRAI